MQTRPSAASLFVGRGPDLGELRDRFAESASLITITGYAGVGKTRLAREYADRYGDQHSGGVWFIDLATARGPDEVCAAVGATLEVPMTGDSSTEESVTRLGHAMSARGGALLILDNFEQLIECARHVVDEWLHRCDEVSFLVTSRERLGLGKEVVFALEPIPASVATELFIARARMARRDFDIAPDDASVRAIVERLDCIPLAIELAAAQMHHLGPEDLLRHLEHRFDVLDERGAIEWSWALLSDPERHALSQMAVFRGSFTVDAVAAIVVGDTPAIRLVEALARKSLLQVVAPGRYRLFESTREFAAEKLEASGHLDAVSERHAAHYAATPETGVASEIANILAAHAWAADADRWDLTARAALAVAPVLILRGPNVLLRSLLDRVIDVAATGDDGLLAEALQWRARAMGFLGEHDAGLRDNERAVSLARAAGIRTVEAVALAEIAKQLAKQGSPERAKSSMEAALRVARDLDAPDTEASVLSASAVVYWHDDQIDTARDKLARALDLARETGDRGLEGRILGNLGVLARDCGETEAHRDYAKQALDCLRSGGDRQNEALALINYSGTKQHEGELEDARRSLADARDIARDIGARSLEGIAELCLASLAQDTRGAEHGAEHFERAKRLHDRRHVRMDWHSDGLLQARVGAHLAARGHLAEADAMFSGAEAMLSRADDTKIDDILALHRGHLLLANARLAEREGDGNGAARLRHVVLDRLRAIDQQWNGAESSSEPESHLGSANARQELAAAIGMLRRAMSTLAERTPAGDHQVAGDDTLVVGDAAAWFRPPHGDPVNLGKRAALRHLLTRLIAERRVAPGSGIQASELIEAGWPGERIQAEAALNRLHVAIATLRKLGLRNILVKSTDGYRLDEAIAFAEGYQLKTVLEKRSEP